MTPPTVEEIELALDAPFQLHTIRSVKMEQVLTRLRDAMKSGEYALLSLEDREAVALQLHKWSDCDWIDNATEVHMRQLLQVEPLP